MPADYQPSTVLLNAQPGEVAFMLKMGELMWEHKTTTDSDVLISQRLKDLYSDKIASLTQGLADAKNELITSYRRNDQLLSDAKLEYKRALDTLERQLESERNKNDQGMKDLVNNFNKVFSNTSSVKGKAGEELLSAVLKTLYPSAEIIDCSKTTAAGDMIFSLTRNEKEYKILIESKNVTNISSTDVSKFIRDCGLTTCDGALFVSLVSDNIPKKGSYSFEMVNELPIIYLGNSLKNPESIRLAIESLLFASTHLIKEEIKEVDTLSDVKEAITIAHNTIASHSSKVTSMKNAVISLLNTINSLEGDSMIAIAAITEMWKRRPDMRVTQTVGGSTASAPSVLPAANITLIRTFIETHKRDPTKPELASQCGITDSMFKKHGGARGILKMVHT